jgi:hypothetical protein
MDTLPRSVHHVSEHLFTMSPVRTHMNGEEEMGESKRFEWEDEEWLKARRSGPC